MPLVPDTQPPFTQAVSQVPSDESSEPEDNEGTEPEQPDVPQELVGDRDEEVDKQDDEQPSVESGLSEILQCEQRGEQPRRVRSGGKAGPASNSLARQVFRKGLSNIVTSRYLLCLPACETR
jgi:hypothetical protein